MCSSMLVASVWSQLYLMGILLTLPKLEVGVGKDHGEKPSYASGGGRNRGSRCPRPRRELASWRDAILHPSNVGSGVSDA